MMLKSIRVLVTTMRRGVFQILNSASTRSNGRTAKQPEDTPDGSNQRGYLPPSSGTLAHHLRLVIGA